ncbi:MAG: hypothetical protein D6689_04875, partial [Deltaproteobacteria bacterium]
MREFFRAVHDVLDTELFTLSGVPLTVSSLLACALIILIGFALARIAGRGVFRSVVKRGRAPGVAAAVDRIVRYSIFATAVFVALDTIGVNLTALFAGAGVLLVGIGFGLQNIAQNFISGLIVLLERPVKVGDFVKAGEAYGAIEHIGMRATRVVTRDATTILIPNSELITAQVVNLSIPTPQVRREVMVGVEYGSDTARVRDALLAVAAAHPDVLDDPAPEVHFRDFGASSLDFALLVWLRNPLDDLRVCSELRFAIDAAFRDAGI